jgi:hypothetical protein
MVDGEISFVRGDIGNLSGGNSPGAGNKNATLAIFAIRPNMSGSSVFSVRSDPPSSIFVPAQAGTHIGQWAPALRRCDKKGERSPSHVIHWRDSDAPCQGDRRVPIS